MTRIRTPQVKVLAAQLHLTRATVGAKHTPHDATGAEMVGVDAMLQIQEAEMAAAAALETSYAEDARRAQLPTDGTLLMHGSTARSGSFRHTG